MNGYCAQPHSVQPSIMLHIHSENGATTRLHSINYWEQRMENRHGALSGALLQRDADSYRVENIAPVHPQLAHIKQIIIYFSSREYV